jgi:hypothetical protein
MDVTNATSTGKRAERTAKATEPKALKSMIAAFDNSVSRGDKIAEVQRIACQLGNAPNANDSSEKAGDNVSTRKTALMFQKTSYPFVGAAML